MTGRRAAFLPLLALLALLAPSQLQAKDYRLGFSPGGSALQVVLDSIASAKTSILVACYEFTSRDIAEALEAAAHRGVKVRIVADYKAAQGKYSQIRVMLAAGIPIRLDRKYAIMHDKFIVLDGDAVETGSFNYTDAAAKHNAENALWQWGVKELAAAYAAEWERLWAESGKPEFPSPKK
jgi:phosphatidylserine/phosphatidylglycerophosphate/cardiolipin synthase-like enzyme